jgi:WD40 repeat protein
MYPSSRRKPGFNAAARAACATAAVLTLGTAATARAEIVTSSTFRWQLEGAASFKYDAAGRQLHPSTRELARVEDVEELEHYSRVVFLDADRVVTTSWSGFVSAWKVEGGAPAWKARPGGPTPLKIMDVALTADKKFALVVGEAGLLAMLRTQDGKVERTWDAAGGDFRTAVAISADGGLFATGDLHGRVEVWSFAEPLPLASWSNDAASTGPTGPPVPHWGPTHLAFTPDGRFLYAADPSAIRLWNIGTGELVRALGDPDAGGAGATVDPERWWFSSLDFAPDQSYVIAGVYDGARVIDLASGETLRTFTGHPMGVLSSRLDVAKSEVVTVARDFTFRFFDADTAALKREAWLPCPSFPFIYVLADAVFNDAGDRIAMATSDPIWDRMGYYPVLRTYAYDAGL